ncbi:MAG: hypothetical protein H0W18_13460, partial [Acidobacteria bacterium]|nr:hypothetical protein [Acidobacteriota bacterium]
MTHPGSSRRHRAGLVLGALALTAGGCCVEWAGERRYADAAAYVQGALPAGAVVLAMQHSGSLAYYSE